jgi:hypothetical protein
MSLCRFSLKFQRIVQAEQRANFISRLHRGRLNIIPWPVIESKGFYDLFSTLKRQLGLQNVSHQRAGEFLHTIKTLMAKLKVRFPSLLSLRNLTFPNRPMIGAPFLVCSSISFLLSYSFFSTETITDHRARTLSNLLPIALATGFSEVEPDFERLKVQ